MLIDTNIEELTKQYVELREKKKQMEALLEEKLKPLQNRMDSIENDLLRFFETTGQSSAKTKYGTAYTSIVRSVTVSDSNRFFDFIKQNDAFDLLQKRIVSSMYDQYIDDGVEVPGVNVTSLLKVKIRK